MIGTNDFSLLHELRPLLKLCMDSLDLTDSSRTDCDDHLGISGLACGVVPADDYAFIRLLFDKAKRP